MEASRKSYSRQLWTGRAQVLAAASVGGGVTGAAAYMGLPPEAIGAAASAGMLGTGGVQLYALKVLEHEEANLLSAEGLNRIFQNHYSNQVVWYVRFFGMLCNYGLPSSKAALRAHSTRGQKLSPILCTSPGT